MCCPSVHIECVTGLCCVETEEMKLSECRYRSSRFACFAYGHGRVVAVNHKPLQEPYLFTKSMQTSLLGGFGKKSKPAPNIITSGSLQLTAVDFAPVTVTLTDQDAGGSKPTELLSLLVRLLHSHTPADTP